jgi:O-antigen/teichoic acid export membrane protein
MSKSRAKLLIENFFAYGSINVINKIIPLLLLPVITRLLKNPSDFGVFDMYQLIVSFGSPLVMLGLYDAMFREYFEKDDQEYKYNVTSTANRIILVTSVIVAVILITFNSSLSKVFFGTQIYGTVIIFSAIELFFRTNRSIIAAPTRIQNKRTIYLISGITQSLSYYLLAILLIYLGYSYFGMIYANIVSTIVLVIFFWILNKDFFTLGKYDKKIAKELLKIGVPLLPTFLIYWVFHSMDRIMIANMLDTTQLGIYSIGARVASVSTIIYAAFSGGWQYFAFSTMRDEDYKYMMGKVWEVLFVISSCFFIVAFLFKDLIFNILFTGDYTKGVIVFPFLLYAPFLQMLYQVLGTQFQIIKKTYYSPLMLFLGAIANLGLNYFLIPIMGIKGAAIATLVGFVVTVIVAILVVVIFKKLICFKTKTYIILLIFSSIFVIFVFRDINIFTITTAGIYFIFCLLLYYKEALKIIKKEKLR